MTRMVNRAILAPHETQRLVVIYRRDYPLQHPLGTASAHVWTPAAKWSLVIDFVVVLSARHDYKTNGHQTFARPFDQRPYQDNTECRLVSKAP